MFQYSYKEKHAILIELIVTSVSFAQFFHKSGDWEFLLVEQQRFYFSFLSTYVDHEVIVIPSFKSKAHCYLFDGWFLLFGSRRDKVEQ
ncbi:hypothetical protein DAI22_03g232701 [Oryza sativa Japonica Group]|nr:hypothetical protein DAI22_03g232701 [Oryza sativa Japonica Group]